MEYKPRLSTGANRPELSKKELPLCLEMSDEMQLAMYLNREDDVKSDKKLLFNANDLVPISKLVATQVILFNYTLLEEYEFYRYKLVLREKIADLSNDKFTIKDFMNRGLDTLTNGVLEREQTSYERKGPTNRIKIWKKIDVPELSDKDLEFYEKLSVRRNELTHESGCKSPTLYEALTFFHNSRVVAKGIAHSFSDNTIEDCNMFLDEYITEND